MNILFINSIGVNKLGGGEKWMVRAARGLMNNGHRVFLAGKPGSEILAEATKTGVPTRVFNIRADISPIATWKIYRFLKAEQIDVLICNLNKDVRVAGLAARFAGHTVVLARHGILLAGKKWKHKVTLTNLADGIITNSTTIRDAYQNYGWFPDGFVRVIYNGIADKSTVVAHDFSKDYPGKTVIFSSGRLAEQKGFDDLITAFAQVHARRPETVLVIAGKGKLEQDLRQLASRLGVGESVHLIGFLDNPDPFTKGCHLFVLSSLFEGMPNVVMEAMALGKPAIATDVNGARELMGDTGWIVPPKNPGILAQTILKVLSDPTAMEQAGKAGLDRVKGHFTIPAMVSQLEQFFQEKCREKQQRTPEKNH